MDIISGRVKFKTGKLHLLQELDPYPYQADYGT